MGGFNGPCLEVVPITPILMISTDLSHGHTHLQKKGWETESVCPGRVGSRFNKEIAGPLGPLQLSPLL